MPKLSVSLGISLGGRLTEQAHSGGSDGAAAGGRLKETRKQCRGENPSTGIADGDAGGGGVYQPS